MNMKRGSISLTLEVNLVVKAAKKPNRMPKATPPSPTTKKLATPRSASTGSTTGMFTTKLNMLHNTWKYKHTGFCANMEAHTKVMWGHGQRSLMTMLSDLLKYLRSTVCFLIILFCWAPWKINGKRKHLAKKEDFVVLHLHKPGNDVRTSDKLLRKVKKNLLWWHKDWSHFYLHNILIVWTIFLWFTVKV